MCRQSRKTKGICGVLLLALLITLFSGCTGKNKGEPGSGQGKQENAQGTAGGRFLESDITLPENIKQIKAFRKLEDDSMEAVVQNTSNAYEILRRSQKEKEWRSVKCKEELDDFIPFTAIAPDGKVLFLGYVRDGIAEGSFADETGELTECSFSLPEQDTENQLRQIVYDDQGTLYALDAKGAVLRVDPSGGACEKAFETDGINVNYFCAAGRYLVAVHDDGILLFDTREGERLESEPLLDDMIKRDARLASAETDSGIPMIFGSGGEDSFLFASHNGIFHYTIGGSVIEELADASLTSLAGSPVFYDMAVWGRDEIILAIGNGEEQDKLLQYSYDKDAASAPKQEITVYALEESALLRRAATMFQKKYPDIYVNLEFGTSGEDGVTWEDALSVLNTNILSGKGPDVLILDGMPVESYVEKGVLADISDIVGEVEKEDGLFTNIKEANLRDGKLYSMPVRLLLPMVEGDREVVRSGGSLASLAEEAVRRKKKTDRAKVTQEKGTTTLLQDCFDADSAQWMKEDGTLDRDALTGFLTNVKKLYDVDSHRREEDEGGSKYEEKVGTLSESGLLSGEWSISFGTLAGMYSYQMMVSAQEQTKAGCCLMNHDKVKSYVPYLEAGVTAGGDVETAKAFVKELLGKKLGENGYNGFPVNRAAYQQLCETKMDDPNVRDEAGISISGGSGSEIFSFQLVNLTQKQIDALTQQLESVEKPALTNRVIQEIVLEQGEKYILGEQELEETADTILKKVNLYLSE